MICCEVFFDRIALRITNPGISIKVFSSHRHVTGAGKGPAYQSSHQSGGIGRYWC